MYVCMYVCMYVRMYVCMYVQQCHPDYTTINQYNGSSSKLYLSVNRSIVSHTNW